jgi:hypothetical protein
MSLMERFRAYLRSREAEKIRQARAEGYQVWGRHSPRRARELDRPGPHGRGARDRRVGHEHASR